MSEIHYDYKQNKKMSLEGACEALSRIFGFAGHPSSLLDVGCGHGIWLHAANQLGIEDVEGIDGVELPPSELMIDETKFTRIDLESHWCLGRRFDMVLCLEVAEHLSEPAAKVLIESLTEHSDRICFSAACPGQGGQHHVNLQWPSYWQNIFNDYGFRCEDDVRWILWQDSGLLPWYRQNIMFAFKDPAKAGQESRIRSVVHPSMVEEYGLGPDFRSRIISQIENGSQSLSWYLSIPFRGIFAKISRRI